MKLKIVRHMTHMRQYGEVPIPSLPVIPPEVSRCLDGMFFGVQIPSTPRFEQFYPSKPGVVCRWGLKNFHDFPCFFFWGGFSTQFCRGVYIYSKGSCHETIPAK